MIYIVILFPFFLASLLEISNVRMRDTTILFIILIIILAGMRENTGTDYKSYLSFWEYIKPINEGLSLTYGGIEPGFIILIAILKVFTKNSIIYFFVCAILSIVPLYFGLKKIEKKYILTSLILFFLVFYIPYTFNGMRQAISMSLFILAVPYMLKQDTIVVVILSLIASIFHTTGFLIIISYIVMHFKYNINHFFIIGLIISLLFLKIGLLDFFLFNVIGINPIVYTENFETKTSIFQIITRGLIVFLFLYFGNMIKNDQYNKLLSVYLLGFFIYISLFNHNMLATRFNMFFRILEIILIPLLLIKCKDKTNKLILYIAFLIPCIYSFYITIASPDNYYKIASQLF